jgi:hypothetical protein
MKLFKSISSLILILFIFVTTSLVAQSEFQGKVKFKISDDEQTSSEMEYLIKDNKFRINMQSPVETSVIFKDDKVTVIMWDQNQYIEMPKSIMENFGKKAMQNSEDKEDIDFEKYKTGKTKTIQGYTCENWLYNDGEGTFEIWATNDLGNFIFFQNPFAPQPGWYSKVSNKGFFPMLMEAKDKTGKVVFKYETTEVNETNLNNSNFEAPANLSKMTIPTFGQ